jgi:uncharacterized peroxidase-related enzyme
MEEPMPTLKPVDPGTASGKTKVAIEAVQKAFGLVPNIAKIMANSPAVVQGWLDFNAALNGAAISPKLRELIAVAVAEANRCEYCLSAHTAIGKMVGLDDNELLTARQCKSRDPKIDAALQFAHEIVVRRGELGAADVEKVRQAGYTDGEIVEIIAVVCLTIFTNYFNHIAKTEVDFPRVEIGLKQSA